MRWHRLEPAGALHVRRPDGIVMRTEIDRAFADTAWQADYVQKLATYPPCETFVAALLFVTWLLVAVATGRLFATGAIAHNVGARVARFRNTKWTDTARAQ
jgi:hypothetical protein